MKLYDILLFLIDNGKTEGVVDKAQVLYEGGKLTLEELESIKNLICA